MLLLGLSGMFGSKGDASSVAASSWSVSKAGKRVERDPDARRLS